MASQWHYVINGEQKGPVRSRELLELAQSGELKPDDLVWKQGQKDWKPAHKVKGLFVEAEEEASPSPPQDEPKLGEAAKELLAALTVQTKKTGKKAIQAANDWRQKRAEPTPPPAAQPQPAARPVRRRRKKKKLVFIAAAIGLFVILFMCSGLFGPQGKLLETPSIFNGSTKNYTVDELRKEIQLKKYKPKSKFYSKYGKPYRISDGYKRTRLYYRCEDGIARIECLKRQFQHDNTIYVWDVEQSY
jgi:hypothetical protein